MHREPSGEAHGRSRPDACSVVAQDVGVSAYGTAAPATFWLALEQNGPWGQQAATHSHLPYHVGWQVERDCAVRGGRLVLIRHPTAHPDRKTARRRCFVAWSGPGAFLLGGDLGSAEEVFALDLDALARGDEQAVVASLPTLRPSAPVLFVCTNGKRDVCCAVRGRPVAAAAHHANPDRVWECSHIGGHRFSPTGVLLPWGRNIARLDRSAALDLLPLADERRLPVGLLGPLHDRGWSAVPPGVQAAESAVRAHLGETDLEALRAWWTLEPATRWAGMVAVEHRDGRRWRVTVERAPSPVHPGSCRALAVAAPSWQADPPKPG